MEKEDLSFLAQLLNTMREIAEKIEEHYKGGNSVKLNSAKRELLNLQEKVNEII